MEKSRESMVIYRSFYDAIKLLPDAIQLEILRAICEYGLDEIEPTLSDGALPFWLLIKPNLQANRTKWENGCKAKSKQVGSKTEAKHKQKRSKNEANVDVDVDVDVRGKIDISDLSRFESKYEKSMLADFQAYWTEKNSKGKMRYEAEKFFDVSRRLATWARNQSSYNKNKKEANHYVPGEKPGEWRPPHHKLLDFSGTIETR